MSNVKLVTIFRKAKLSRSCFWLMFLIDFVLFAFFPVFVFILSLIVHVIVYFVALDRWCDLYVASVKELCAQKECAPAPSDDSDILK